MTDLLHTDLLASGFTGLQAVIIFLIWRTLEETRKTIILLTDELNLLKLSVARLEVRNERKDHSGSPNS
jgi:hypothetical protein